MLSYLLGNKGKDLENLFLTSFQLTIEGDLKTPYIKRLIFSAVMHALSFLSVMMIFYKWNQEFGFFMIFFTAFILLPYSFLFHIKMRATLSWISYACITKKNTSISEANSKISEIAWSLRFLAFVEFMIANRGSKNDGEEGGFGSFLKNLIIEMVVAVIDVAENYLLPTMVIEQVSIKDAVPKLTEMKNNIPATLVGAFGFDLIGDAISSFSFLIYFCILAGGLGLSFLLGSVVPVDLKSNIAGHTLFIFPALLSCFLCSYIGSFIKISATSLKAIYFSIFYTSINKPLEINESYRDNVTNYLNFTDSSVVDSFKQDFKKIFPNVSKGQTANSESIIKSPVTKQAGAVGAKVPPKAVDEAVTSQPLATVGLHIKPELMEKAWIHVGEMKEKGASDQQVLDFFIKKGWPQDIVTQLLETKKKTG